MLKIANKKKKIMVTIANIFIQQYNNNNNHKHYNSIVTILIVVTPSPISGIDWKIWNKILYLSQNNYKSQKCYPVRYFVRIKPNILINYIGIPLQATLGYE